jgi:hypothetical protein
MFHPKCNKCGHWHKADANCEASSDSLQPGGSLPASSVQKLDAIWSKRCEELFDAKDPRVNAVWNCLCDLRAEVGHANRRQPEENKKAET